MFSELSLITVGLETPKYGQTEMWAKLHLQLRTYQTAASPEGNDRLKGENIRKAT